MTEKLELISQGRDFSLLCCALDDNAGVFPEDKAELGTDRSPECSTEPENGWCFVPATFYVVVFN